MKSVMVGLRFKEDIYEALKAKADGQSVADYIKGLVEGVLTPVNSPTPSVTPKAEVIAQLRQLIKPVEAEKKALVPLYNASIHRAGDRVRVFDGNRLVEMVVPELDADGQPVPQMASSASLRSTSNLMKPSFQPDPKPPKKVKKGRRWK